MDGLATREIGVNQDLWRTIILNMQHEKNTLCSSTETGTVLGYRLGLVLRRIACRSERTWLSPRRDPRRAWRYRPASSWISAVVVLLSAGLASSSYGGDPTSEQIERARVLRELGEIPPAADGDGRAVLPPARIEIEKLEGTQEQEATIENDQRWRNLLGDQARERNVPNPVPGAAQIRSLQDGRAQDAQDLHRRIERQDLEYRLKRNH